MPSTSTSASVFFPSITPFVDLLWDACGPMYLQLALICLALDWVSLERFLKGDVHDKQNEHHSASMEGSDGAGRAQWGEAEA